MPDQNMWVVLQPLIEHWARDNLGVEAHMRAAVSETLEASAHLPRILARADRVLEKLEGSVGTEPLSMRVRIRRPHVPSTLHLLLTLASDLVPGLSKGAQRLSALHLLLTLMVCLFAALLVLQLL